MKKRKEDQFSCVKYISTELCNYLDNIWWKYSPEHEVYRHSDIFKKISPFFSFNNIRCSFCWIRKKMDPMEIDQRKWIPPGNEQEVIHPTPWPNTVLKRWNILHLIIFVPKLLSSVTYCLDIYIIHLRVIYAKERTA